MDGPETVPTSVDLILFVQKESTRRENNLPSVLKWELKGLTEGRRADVSSLPTYRTHESPRYFSSAVTTRATNYTS